MRIYKEPRTSRWYVDYFFRGKRYRYKAGSSRRAAEQLRLRIESEVNTGKHSPAAVREEMIRLSEDKPGLALRPGLASQVGDWRIEAGVVEEEGARLAGVLLFMPTLGETVFSKAGSIRTARPKGRGASCSKTA